MEALSGSLECWAPGDHVQCLIYWFPVDLYDVLYVSSLHIIV